MIKQLCIFLLVSVSLLPIETKAQSSKKIRLSPVGLGMDLPDSYKQRTFIKGLAGFVNKIDQLVGAMILIDVDKTTVLTRFIKHDKPPIITATTSDVLFSAKVDHRFKFNGTYSIASTKIEKDVIREIIITDIGFAFLPEDYIPYVDICRASVNVSAETRKKTFYIRSAKLTTVYTRAFQKVSTDGEISGLVFSIGGEVYNSSEQFKVDYIVSVDIVSLEKLLSLQNCNELITSEELTRREKAEQARLIAQKAEDEKRARENELVAAKLQVEELKRILSNNLIKTEEMQHALLNAQEKEKQALTQLQQAIRQADEMSARAIAAQQQAETKESVILTFKNKEGKVLEIKNLEELSQEKLRELGFDVEVLFKGKD